MARNIDPFLSFSVSSSYRGAWRRRRRCIICKVSHKRLFRLDNLAARSKWRAQQSKIRSNSRVVPFEESDLICTISTKLNVYCLLQGVKDQSFQFQMAACSSETKPLWLLRTTVLDKKDQINPNFFIDFFVKWLTEQKLQIFFYYHSNEKW